MGKLIGVTPLSIYRWEQGKARPRANQLVAIAEARKMGKKSAVAKIGA
jgi:transcriptional regulator with XRE-family HTH domain